MAQRLVHWAHLDVGILSDEKISIVRAMPEGDSMFVVWIGLICLAMKCCDGGFLYAAQGVPYTTEHLSKIFNVSKPVVDQAVQIFEKLEMLSTHNSSSIELLNFTRHQGEDALEKLREASRRSSEKYRKNQNLKLLENKRENKRGDVTVTSLEKEPTSRELIYGFTEFKDIYPKNFDMEAARREWMKIRPGKKLKAIIIEAVKRHIQSKKWKEENGKFIPSPAKYLRDKRWKDKLETPNERNNPLED